MQAVTGKQREGMNNKTLLLKHDGVFTTAFWQLMSFILLIVIIWIDEVLDLSNLWFGMRPEHPNFYKGCSLTIVVLSIAVITIGNTYIHQKRLIRKLLLICSNCRKVRINENEWQHLETYVADQLQSMISHGLCPQCYEVAVKDADDYRRLFSSAEGQGESKK